MVKHKEQSEFSKAHKQHMLPVKLRVGDWVQKHFFGFVDWKTPHISIALINLSGQIQLYVYLYSLWKV